jgi:hypothetical protein
MMALHKDILASYREVLASEKEILASHKEILGRVKAYGSISTPGESIGEPRVTDETVRLKQRKEMAEEKSRFEKQVQERTKTIDWYEKEFSVALVPLGVRESIISKMPNSVIKKGFQRLSEKDSNNFLKRQ